VSWFRLVAGTSRLRVLTVGQDVFSPDGRLAVRRDGRNWQLRLRPASAADDGTYVCQISTHPPSLLVAHLLVVAPRARFVDGESGRAISEKHYKPGSTVELTCVVSHYSPAFGPVRWRHKGRRVVDARDGEGGEGVR